MRRFALTATVEMVIEVGGPDEEEITSVNVGIAAEYGDLNPQLSKLARWEVRELPPSDRTVADVKRVMSTSTGYPRLLRHGDG